MSRRPRSVTLIGGLFIAAGAIGFAYHAGDLRIEGPFRYELVWVLFLRLLAIVGGIFVLRGANWARWLLLLWMGYHVVLSALHSVSELIMHSVLFAVIAYVLFRAQASAYFRNRTRPVQRRRPDA
jgi:hypothetical protein